jgi:hypothetical protein
VLRLHLPCLLNGDGDFGALWNAFVHSSHILSQQTQVGEARGSCSKVIGKVGGRMGISGGQRGITD